MVAGVEETVVMEEGWLRESVGGDVEGGGSASA